MIELIAVGISGLALILSGAALYFVNFWKGRIKCSKPVQFFFGYASEDKTTANVSIQCFIHSTGIVGQVIDHMFVEVKQGETKQRFTTWMAGSPSNPRVKVAGFKIPSDGHNIDFIFFTPAESHNFRFNKGEIKVTMNARLSGTKKHITLCEERFTINKSLLDAINSLDLAVFELNSTGENYHSYGDKYLKELPKTGRQLIENDK